MKRTKTEKGITLIALIITVIILLILAVVARGAVQNDGIIQHAKNARDEYGKAQENEQGIIDGYLEDLENITLLPYFGKPYNMTIGSDLMSYVFYEDGSAKLYFNGVLGEQATAGTIIYGDGTVNVVGTIGSLSSDRKQIDMGNGTILVLGELPLLCGEPNHSADDGLDHWTEATCGQHSYKCQCSIPVGAVYKTNSGTILKGENGDEFPDTVSTGDKYTYGDYEYCYNNYSSSGDGWYWKSDASQNGWGVKVIKNRNNTQYSEILSSINGKPITNLNYTFMGCRIEASPTIPITVTNMEGTFQNCNSLTDVKVIPDSVVNMNKTFFNCTALTTISNIPSNVTNMNATFFNCTALTTVPTIPSKVNIMSGTFQDCTSLAGDLQIDANPSSYNNCFSGTVEEIYLRRGASNMKEEIAKTATNNNVFWKFDA